MREILFRGKRIDNGEWVVGMPWIFAPPVNKAVIVYAMGLVGEDDDISRYCECHEVDPSTVGQYTGVTDKNGKRIFEGDILNTTQFGSVWYNATVEWEKGEFLVVPHRTYPHEKMPAKSGWLTSRLTEVIGNIHDNPELLENKP